jgi:single-strand DNA-binding protein
MEIEGKIAWIGDTQVKSEKFSFREIALEFADGKYNQYALLKFSQDKTKLLDSFKVGHLVKVQFGIRGREWNGKYFSNLEAWRIELIQGLNDPKNAPAYEPDEDPFKDYATVEKDIRKDPEFQRRMDEQLPF